MDPTWSEEEAIQWVVSVFPDAHAHLSDLGTDLCDGVLLVALVSRLSHADARLIIENPSNLKERTLNAREAIFLARSLGVKRKINAEGSRRIASHWPARFACSHSMRAFACRVLGCARWRL